MTIAKQDVTELLMVRARTSGDFTVKEDTGVRIGRISVHPRKIMIGKSKPKASICRTISTGRSVTEWFFFYSRKIGSLLLGCGRTDIHLHIRKDAIENQRLKSLRRGKPICSIIRTCRSSTERQDDIIREVGVKLESETDLLLIGRAGDSAGFFTGRVQRGEEHAGEDCDNRNYHNQWYIIITNKTFTENLL